MSTSTTETYRTVTVDQITVGTELIDGQHWSKVIEHCGPCTDGSGDILVRLVCLLQHGTGAPYLAILPATWAPQTIGGTHYTRTWTIREKGSV